MRVGLIPPSFFCMECLSEIVGIKGCGNEAALFYVNNLPAISIRTADAAIDSEYSSAIAMMREKIDTAATLITNRIQSYFNPRFKGGSIIENGIAGYYLDNLQLLTAQPYLIGKQFSITEYPYLEFYLSKISLQVNFSGIIDVLVYDLIQNKLLDTIPVTCVAGEISSVDISKSYPTNGQDMNLFICYDATLIDSYSTNLTKSGCNSCTGYTYSNRYISISQRKINSIQKIAANLELNESDGLSVLYSLNCTFKPFVCSNKHLLAEALWYKAGSLIMEELRYTKRFNSIIQFNADHAELASAYGTASDTALSNILQNMKLPDNICFSCNQKMTLETRI